MNVSKIKILLFFILCLCAIPLCAGTKLPADTLNRNKMYRDSVYRRVIKEGTARLTCYFSYPQGGSQILRAYANNAYELNKLDNFIHSSLTDTLIYVRRIVLTGYCSVEGSYAHNEQLARDRANGFYNYLNFQYRLAKRYLVEVNYIGEDWLKLRELVDSSMLSEKQEVMDIIDHVDVFKGREKLLMDLNAGIPYRIMMKDLFPLLRRVEIVVEYDLHRIIEERYRRKLTDAEFNEILARERAAAEAEERRLAEQKRQEEAIAARAELKRQEKERAEQQRLKAERLRAEEARRIEDREIHERYLVWRASRRAEQRKKNTLYPFIALKTNLMYWGGITPDPKLERTIVTPNLSAELFFLRRWSVDFSALYVNRDYDNGSQHWGVSGYSIEPRFWFKGDGKYRWFYVGAYGMAGDFDNHSTDAARIEKETENSTGTYWQGGLALGCYILLNAHWGIEIGVRGGYRSANAHAYDIESSLYYLNHDYTASHYGLTGMNISVCYRIGSKGSKKSSE